MHEDAMESFRQEFAEDFVLHTHTHKHTSAQNSIWRASGIVNEPSAFGLETGIYMHRKLVTKTSGK